MHTGTLDRRVATRIGVLVMLMLAVPLWAACSGSGSDSTSAATTPATTPPTTSAAPTTSTSTTTTLPPTTTTTIPIITKDAVVLVANASDVDGAAGDLAAQLASLGFAMNPATNAAGNEEKLAVSKVYFLPLGEPAARSIALLMGGVEVYRMPVPAWIFGGSEALFNTNVLVMLGKDLAGKPLPGLPG